uniref:RNA helicase n=1 Tax=Oreochromis aureus TaxID=47969 RepID=A0AAZ1XSG2_OREAU
MCMYDKHEHPVELLFTLVYTNFFPGLTEPVLIRLDHVFISSNFHQLSFFHLRVDDKPALLLHLLRNVVKPQEQTVVFAATKHHVEYLKELLSSEGLECAYIYSALDQTARKINIGKFVHRKAMVLLVTDVAARGIDIALLDNVINYNFPSKAKLFLHRVGEQLYRAEVAQPIVYDLHLFLERPVQFASPEHTEEGVFGRVPQRILDDESAHLITSHENSLDLQNLLRVSENAYKQYLKSRPNPSPDMGVHPVLGKVWSEKMELECLQIVDAIKSYKSKATIFEINSSSKTPASEVMRAKRSKDTRLVDKFSKQREDRAAESRLQQPINPTTTADCDITEKEERVFSEVVGGKRRGQQEDGEERPKTKKKRQSGKDEEYYIPYRPKDFDSERGLSLGGEGSAFEQQASSAVLDLMGDEGDRLNQQKKMMKWDRKKKRFVRETGKEDQKKKIKTDSGQVISNKKNRKNLYPSNKSFSVSWPWPTRSNVQSSGDHKARSELKTKDQIMKQRKKKQKHQFLQGGGMSKLRSKNKKWLGEVKKSGFGRGGHKKGKLRKKL